MKIAFILLAIACLAGAAFVGIYGLLEYAYWEDLEEIMYLFLPFASLISGALLSAFAASVLHGFDRQVAATKELHGAIVASAKGEEPSLPTVEDNEVPEHLVRAKYEDDMAGRTLFRPKP